jgi:indole-3-glycerol phosphate synthase
MPVMSILDRIISQKKEDLENQKRVLPFTDLKERLKDREYSYRSFREGIRRKKDQPLPSLIAEIKKASPSKGIIREDFNLLTIANTYEKKKVSAISVLTEEHFFMGKLSYLEEVKTAVTRPVLRKDFIFEQYQIVESKLNGADAVLLISASLEKAEIEDLLGLAHELFLDCLVEVHTLKELDRALYAGAEIVGINNRNLSTFEVNLNRTLEMLPDIPPHKVVVSESGISTYKDVEMLEQSGVDAMLIGSAIMKSPDMGQKIDELLGRDRV